MAKLDIKYKDEKDFYIKYIEILSPILGLSKKERRILSELMYKFNSKTNLSSLEKYRVILSYDGRVELCETINISNQTLRNTLSIFRKKKYLIPSSNNVEELASFLRITPKLKSIEFNFILNE